MYAKPDINFRAIFDIGYDPNNLLDNTPEIFKKWYWYCGIKLLQIEEFCYDPNLNINYIRMEHNEDYFKFKKFFQFDESFLDQKLNVSRKIDNYSLYYDNEIKKDVYNRFNIDFKIGKYSYDI